MAKRRKKGIKDKKGKKGFGLPLKRSTIVGIIQIALLATGGLILVSFSRQGPVLIKLNDYLMTYFGWSSVILPFIFISFGFAPSKLKLPIGQPNVIIGSLLFFLSITSLSRAGIFGSSAWQSLVSLVTSAGAFVVLVGMTLVGLIILFNTSFDQVLLIFAALLRNIRKILVGDKPGLQTNSFINRKRDMKVIGGENRQVDDDKTGGGRNSVRTESRNVPQSQGQQTDLQDQLVSNLPGEQTVWKYPPLSLLNNNSSGKADRGDIKGNAATIEQTLESFGVKAQVVEVNLGPAVTQYAIEVALGTKLSKITALERDLALALAAPTGAIRIEAPIPGRSLVGIELPNRTPEFVALKKIIDSDVMEKSKSLLAVALGLDVGGKPIIADIARMPHCLIAGQTGSGKSVCLNAFLATMLFRTSPSELKLIMVDPKRVELTGYNGIPHMLAPVIVEPEKVISALRWLLAEMERRYKLFAQAGVRNIDGYNEMSGFQALPYIVLVIDELADIMLFSPVEVEDSITRIAQMSRATGIHMILATQRPSVDVITGLIKANIPTRIAFAVSSQVDSRVVLDMQGAEKLLGKGDMLYLPPEQAKPLRIQGAFVDDKDVNELVAFLKNQGIEPQYTEEVTSMPKPGTVSVPGMSGETDDLFKRAVEMVCEYDRASASLLQRKLSIGYARAARILDQLEEAGVVSGSDGSSKPREVLIRNPQDLFGGN